MRLARLRTDDGIVEGRYTDGRIVTDVGDYLVGRDGSLTYPCSPSALYCVGRNYAATLDQMDYERPPEPDFFIKPPTALLAPGDPIRYPAWTEELTYAGELAAVIGTRCHDVSPSEVSDVVRGFTIINDVDALDQQGRTARKAFDGSGPLGPWIETDFDPSEVGMETTINGETRQDSNTRQMLFEVPEVVSYLSRRVTLRPGDVIAFGSPANPGTIEPGDVIEITYDGIGTLQNRVVDASSGAAD